MKRIKPPKTCPKCGYESIRNGIGWHCDKCGFDNRAKKEWKLIGVLMAVLGVLAIGAVVITIIVLR